MTDLISRQAAIAYAISGRVRTLTTSEDGEENWIRTEEVRQSLLTMPSAEPKKGKWIPVSEKYPTPWELVWVTDKRGHVNVCQMSHKDNQYWYDEREYWMYEHDAVVAWMPYYVPEPYEGDKK